MADSIETALRLSEGTLLVNLARCAAEGAGPDLQRAVRLPRARRIVRGAGAAQLQLQLAARRLSGLPGLGSRLEIDPDLVLPNDELSVDEGAILPWRRWPPPSWFAKILEAVAEHYGFRTDVPVRDLSPEARQILLYGNRGERVDVKYRARNGNIHTFKTTFEEASSRT